MNKVLTKKVFTAIFSIFNIGSDVALGIITFSIFVRAGLIQPTTNNLLLSVLFTTLPDMDNLIELPLLIFNKVRPDSIHRKITHFPLLYLPVGFFIMYINLNLGLLFFLNITLHFLHDSIAGGWGISWYWPLNKNYYKFFSDKRSKLSKNLLQKWERFEHYDLREKFRDDFWMQNLYFNSWRMKYFKTYKNGPAEEWLKELYGRLRWVYYGEIIITLVGIWIILH